MATSTANTTPASMSLVSEMPNGDFAKKTPNLADGAYLYETPALRYSELMTSLTVPILRANGRRCGCRPDGLTFITGLNSSPAPYQGKKSGVIIEQQKAPIVASSDHKDKLGRPFRELSAEEQAAWSAGLESSKTQWQSTDRLCPISRHDPVCQATMDAFGPVPVNKRPWRRPIRS